MEYVPYGLMSHRRVKNAVSNMVDFDYIVLHAPDDADSDYYLEEVDAWMRLSEEKEQIKASGEEPC